MAAGKWIGGIVGWMAGGPLGALAGYLLGSLFEVGMDAFNTPENSGTFGAGTGRAGGFSGYEEAYRQIERYVKETIYI
jgi:DnaJ like chaperone protein